MFNAQPDPHHAGRSASQLYRRVGVESQVVGNADAHGLVAMLFDGFFEAVAQARGALLEGHTERKGRAIARALGIVDEGLRAPLDLRAGGALARDLRELYAYVSLRLVQANLNSDAAALDECQRLMQPLREAWAAIDPRAAVAA